MKGTYGLEPLVLAIPHQSAGVSRLFFFNDTATNEIYTILEDRDGGIWIGTVSGLNQLQDSIFTSFGAPEGLPANTLRIAALEEADHAIWISGDQGILRLKGDSIVPFANHHERGLFPLAVHSNTLSQQGLVLISDAGRVVMRPNSRSRIMVLLSMDSAISSTTEWGICGKEQARSIMVIRQTATQSCTQFVRFD
jgi:ligand-binding sensor domain-containing protein